MNQISQSFQSLSFAGIASAGSFAGLVLSGLSFENMSFASMSFIIFLLAVFLLYYIVPKKIQWIVLLIASAAFYVSYGWQKAGFILAATLMAWIGGLWINRIYRKAAERNNAEAASSGGSDEEGGRTKANIASSGVGDGAGSSIKVKTASAEGDGDKAEACSIRKAENARKRALEKKAKQRARRVLILFAVILIGMLVYSKIGKWLIEQVSTLTAGKTIDVTVLTAIGISYYTFSLVGYLADVYWRKCKPEKNFFRLLLFCSFFPKVLQGPISSFKNLGPQLREPHHFDYRSFTFGIQRMCWGYFKKLVIADRLAMLVNHVFGMSSPAGAYVLVAAIFSAFQLYCDFSGCMDIVLGISEALGLQVEENFNHPFFARSAAEFWRRWHITLGAWFKDYIYMPIAVSPKMLRFGKFLKNHVGARFSRTVVTLIPTYIVWILTGLWHATGWNYLVWGLMWGTLIGLSVAFDREIRKLSKFFHINTDAGSWKVFQMVRTFLIFCVGRMITIPGDLAVTGKLFHNLFAKFQPWLLVDGSLYSIGLDRPNFLLSIVCLLLLWFVSWREERGVRMRERLAESNLVFRWIIYYALFFAILIFGIYGPGYDASAFVYMNY